MNDISALFDYWLSDYAVLNFTFGVVIPALLSLFFLFKFSRDIFQYWRAILVGNIINLIYTAYQVFYTWEHGLHLIAVFVLYMLHSYHKQKKMTISIPVAYCSMWLSMIVPDLAGGLMYSLWSPLNTGKYNPIETLSWLGGAGPFDGLFCFPLLAAATSLIFQKVHKFESLRRAA